MRGMTEKQHQVLGFIEHFLQQHGYPPTRSEIAKAFGWKSGQAAEPHVRALERKGRLVITPGVARGIRVV